MNYDMTIIAQSCKLNGNVKLHTINDKNLIIQQIVKITYSYTELVFLNA